MDLSYIRTFLHVVEVGNVAKAAQDLKYSQSTVTSQMKALEKEMGISLFEKVGRQNQLTPAGHTFLHYAAEIENTVRKASMITTSPESDHSSLHIGTVESLMTGYLTPIIPEFRKRYPNIALVFNIGPQISLAENLDKGNYDLIFVYTNLTARESFRTVGMKNAETIFLAGKDHPLASGKKIPYSEFLQYPVLTTEKTSGCYRHFLDDSAAIGIDFRYSVMVNSNYSILELLKDNRSVTLLSRCCAENALASGIVVPLDVDLPEKLLPAQMITRRNTWISPPLEHLIELIQQYEP